MRKSIKILLTSLLIIPFSLIIMLFITVFFYILPKAKFISTSAYPVSEDGAYIINYTPYNKNYNYY